MDNITLPDGVFREDVTVESDVEAFTDQGKFNPQNGRWYETFDPGCAAHDTTDVVGGLEVNCAYEDCDGHTTVRVKGSVSRGCPECGEPAMGRKQFTSEYANKRDRRRDISDRTASLRDDFSKEMKELTDAGVGAVAAMDYVMCSIGEIPYEEWAEARGVSHRAVKRNMKRVADAVGDTVTVKTRGG